MRTMGMCWFRPVAIAGGVRFAAAGNSGPIGELGSQRKNEPQWLS